MRSWIGRASLAFAILLGAGLFGQAVADKVVDLRGLDRQIAVLDEGLFEVRQEREKFRRAVKDPKIVVWPLQPAGWRALPLKELARRVRILQALLPQVGHVYYGLAERLGVLADLARKAVDAGQMSTETFVYGWGKQQARQLGIEDEEYGASIAELEREMFTRMKLRDRMRQTSRSGGSATGGSAAAARIRPGRYHGAGGFATVILTGGGGSITGTYSSTYNKKKPGGISFTYDSACGAYSGKWWENAASRRGVLEKIRVSNGGKTIKATWRVTVPGKLGSRKLPMSKGGATFTWKGAR